MVKKIFSACQVTLNKLIAGFKRFPEPLAAATAMVAVMIYLNHFDFQDQSGSFHNNLVKLAMVLAFAIPIYLIIRLWFERAPVNLGVKTAVSLGALGGLTAYYCYGLKTFAMVPMTRYSALTIAFYLTLIIIPYFYKRENFELYCVRLLTNLTITCFYTIVLYLGVSATLFTIDKLFLLDLEAKPYFDFWLIVAGIFGPAHFLAGFPPFGAEFQINDYPKVIKILFLYIIIPLIIVYAAILYAYFAKIMITGTWPAGIVSHLVLWFGLICSSVFFFLYPIRPSVNWLDTLIKVFPIVMFPLLAMMFVSMGIRVQAYGFTESRYFVLIAGGWITGWMLYCLIRKKPNNLWLPLSLTIIAVLTVMGPLSAFSVSKFDQNQRLIAILRKYDMIRDHKIVQAKHPIAPKEQAKIVAILKYFQSSHGFRELKLLPKNFKLSRIPQVFGFKVKDKYLGRNAQQYFYYENQSHQLLNIKGFDHCIVLQSDTVKRDTTTKLEVDYNSGVLTIRVGERQIFRRTVAELLVPIFRKTMPNSTQTLMDVEQNQYIKVFYVFNNVSGEKDPITEEIEFSNILFTVYIKLDPSLMKQR